MAKGKINSVAYGDAKGSALGSLRNANPPAPTRKGAGIHTPIKGGGRNTLGR